MRILHLTLWYLPGLGYQENFLPKYQATLGHDVWIVTSSHYPRYFNKRQKNLKEGIFQENSVHIVRLPGIQVGFWSQVYFFRLQEVISNVQPEIIHLHGLWSIPVVQFLLRNTYKKMAMVVDDHTDNGNLPTGMGKYGRFFIARWVGNRVLKQGGKLLAVNPFSREFLHRILGFPKEAIRLLLLGINNEDFIPQEQERIRYRELLGIKEDTVVFVTSGRLSPGKGFEMLLRAFGMLHRKVSNTELWIIGTGVREYEDFLHKLVNDLQIDKAVRFIPWLTQRELCAYYNAADVGIMPGKLGGIKEILAVGKPLLVPDHLATKYFVQQGAGIAFMPCEEGMYEAMYHYATNSEARSASGRRALAVVQEKLSWSAIARTSIKLYREVLNSF